MRRGLRTLVIVGIAVLAAVVFWIYRSRSVPDAIHNWTQLWMTQPPVVETTPGGWFEAATLRMSEDFYRADSRSWWGIYLGETVSQIQVQVTYRYGVPLADPAWAIATRGKSTVVIAPAPAAVLPVAFDTATLREYTESGWARFDKQDNLDALRKSLTSLLETRAADPARLALVRDSARRTIAQFVDRWLLPHVSWKPDVFATTQVYFADEVDDALRRQLDDAP